MCQFRARNDNGASCALRLIISADLSLFPCPQLPRCRAFVHFPQNPDGERAAKDAIQALNGSFVSGMKVTHDACVGWFDPEEFLLETAFLACVLFLLGSDSTRLRLD